MTLPTRPNTPSQAHLQGTQSRHTKANLAKEPALFQRFRDTLCHGGHRHSIQVTKTKGEHITGSLLLCWLTNIFSTLYRYQPISSRRNSISFCCYLHHQFFNQQRLRAGHYKIPAQQQALAVGSNKTNFYGQSRRKTFGQRLCS